MKAHKKDDKRQADIHTNPDGAMEGQKTLIKEKGRKLKVIKEATEVRVTQWKMTKYGGSKDKSRRLQVRRVKSDQEDQ